jgi:hypothetical protein
MICFYFNSCNYEFVEETTFFVALLIISFVYLFFMNIRL